MARMNDRIERESNISWSQTTAANYAWAARHYMLEVKPPNLIGAITMQREAARSARWAREGLFELLSGNND